MRHTRPATPEEAQADAAKRYEALERARREGLVSDAEYTAESEELNSFAGYARTIERPMG